MYTECVVVGVIFLIGNSSRLYKNQQHCMISVTHTKKNTLVYSHKVYICKKGSSYWHHYMKHAHNIHTVHIYR
jgi:ABC-type cobalamin/Fe3+-siderophores transport system ATPase subunit